MKSEKQICRLCLNACDIFETITEATKTIFNKLQLQINIDCIKDPVICTSCLENLKNCSTFITTCLKSEKKLKKYCDDNDLKTMEYFELSVLENKDFTCFNRIKDEAMYSMVKGSTCSDDFKNIDMTLGLEQKIHTKHEDDSELGLGEEQIDIKYEDPTEQSLQERSCGVSTRPARKTHDIHGQKVPRKSHDNPQKYLRSGYAQMYPVHFRGRM